MAIQEKPIATPKKGAAPKTVQSNHTNGHFVTRKDSTRKGKRPTRPLVQSVTGVRKLTRTNVLARIKEGLNYEAISILETAFQTSQREIAQVLSITPSTLNRRKKSGLLDTDESDRVVRLARLKDAALAMMQGNDEAAIAWLHAPLDILGGESPLEHASTELGARDVEDLIGRLRHGVFS